MVRAYFESRIEFEFMRLEFMRLEFMRLTEVGSLCA
jgi:hypothetical protein